MSQWQGTDLSMTEFFQQQEKIPVDITPHDPTLQPMVTFGQVNGIHPELERNIKRIGYTTPTPVQKWGIPLLMKGNDLMACAQTGSGKTAAYLFPPINTLLYKRPGHRDPSVLVLAPTRELTTQIYEEAVKFIQNTWIKAACVYGGTEMRASYEALNCAPALVCATPGRLNDLATRNKVSLRNVRFFILDEADRMLDMGFEPQIREIVQKRGLSRDRQTTMCSATFQPDVQHLAADFMRQYTFVAVGRVGGTASTIKQHIIWTEDHDKNAFVLGLLLHQQQMGLHLIFVNMKQTAVELERFLSKQRFPVQSIHGDRTQQQRENALEMFKSGQAPILIATDVAARGLDIPNVAVVIQYDMSVTVDDYVHRVGRTGRIGKTGIAITLWNNRNKGSAPDVCRILKDVGQQCPAWLEGMAVSTGEYNPDEKKDKSLYGGQDIRLRNRGGFDKKAEAERFSSFHNNAYGEGAGTKIQFEKARGSAMENWQEDWQGDQTENWQEDYNENWQEDYNENWQEENWNEELY